MEPDDIRIEAWFAQLPAEVFAAWTTPEQIAQWFAVPPWTVQRLKFDARSGEYWWVEFAHPDGSTYREEGQFQEVSAPRRLAFTLRQIGLDRTSPVTVVTVEFKAHAGGTRVRFVQTGFEDASRRDGNADGWASCFEHLRQLLDRAAARQS